MRTALFSFVLISFAFLIQGAAAQTGAWTSYDNDRFGTTADVPPGWTAGPPPDNNDGLVFTSPDGKARLIISGILNVDDSVDAAFQSYEVPNAGEVITYKHRSGNSITISGTKGAQIFYGKHLLSCHNQIWNSIYLEYPAATKASFDMIVARVAKSLKPGKSWQIPDCGA